jgi:hypothetical protein
VLKEQRGDEHGAAVADQGKRDEARELLAPVYGWFTEGFARSTGVLLGAAHRWPATLVAVAVR